MSHCVRGEFAQDHGELALNLRVDPTGDRCLEERERHGQPGRGLEPSPDQIAHVTTLAPVHQVHGLGSAYANPAEARCPGHDPGTRMATSVRARG